MNQAEQIQLMLNRTAELAAGSSTLRGQGPPGTIFKAREFLKDVSPQQFKLQSAVDFRKQLDVVTQSLSAHFLKQNWGAARKVLNIFLRDVLYNRYLCDHFNFESVENWLEVPLDGDVAENLLAASEGKSLPSWPRIKRLTVEVSDQYQSVARKIAEKENIATVHLDLIFWRRKKQANETI